MHQIGGRIDPKPVVEEFTLEAEFVVDQIVGRVAVWLDQLRRAPVLLRS